MRKPSAFRFVLTFASFESPSMVQLSLFGLAPIGAMMHHFILLRLDRSGLGIQLFFLFSIHLSLTGFKYFVHPVGSLFKSRGARAVERLGPK